MATSVLVTGATGNQGGAVVKHLLESDTEFDVRGLTRDDSGETAQTLSERGVTMVEGDLDDKASLEPHVAEVDAVFAVTNFWTQGYDAQVKQGKNLADVSSEAGVEHFVLSGVGSHWADTGVPHFDSAQEIDQYAQDLELPITVLGPVFFFQNFEAFAEDVVEDGQIALPLEEGVALQMVDTGDVGRAAATVLANPEAFLGERIELAGDELTLSEAADVLADVTGRDVEPVHVPIEDAYDSFGEEFTVMCEWFNEVGYGADLEELEDRFGFEFTDFERYLREHGWEEKEGMASVPGWVKAMQ
ncbi:NmrA/HSCARG family protein [Natronococcus occultus]|uniref:Putative nucleoside-diphosphate sugar epimerase n=1 Tax=Natronococcus occultus SP4 TaxID=694430 RepID=L0JV76_9EURY|nr:NmrA/HSCARG family protein [Natronococcus occultus]AGB36676.1 putative nucleoside-diphosphate sugar epimerase [Natronococcus occultus SP4]